MSFNSSNASSVLLLDGLVTGDVDDATCHLLPSWLLRTYLWIVVGGGVLANILLICTILQCRPRWRKDNHYSDLMVLLLNIAGTDIASLTLLAPFEILVLATREGTWGFVPEYCAFFIGMEALLGLVTVYSLVSLSLHAATSKNILPEAKRIGVKVPICLVWMLAVSLTIPELCSAGIVTPRPAHQLCTTVNYDREHQRLTRVILAAFKVVIPVVILLVSSVVTSVRSCDDQDATPARRHLSRTSLVLAASFAVMSLHRASFAAVHSLTGTPSIPGPDAFRSAPLASATATTPTATLVFAMMHYALAAMRPVLCFAASCRVWTPCCVGRSRGRRRSIM